MSVEGKVKMTLQIQSGKNDSNVCRKFGVVNSTIQNIWKNTTKIISTNEQIGSRIKRVRKAERCAVYDVLLECLNNTALTKYH